ncbi:high mobility group box domain-containing protein [Radiomyces spectabilis]|uniref:high mobility group box domain-containing protein n=1 Tax=Radiomyces spectabilis TaxID=64574 RepID=UPI002220144E|nr:high mobility group box domain-containing protein [Radiomyces spectabilis]KAI8367538.1 high mobility group box domain-containing protein [Radiomyces spectabilis]
MTNDIIFAETMSFDFVLQDYFNIASPPVMTSDVATKDTTAGRKGRKARDSKRIPRPRNAFMLYRQAVHAKIVSNHAGLHNKDICKIAGEMWRTETEEFRRAFRRAADEERLLHSSKYPGYKYQPQTKKRDSPLSRRQRAFSKPKHTNKPIPIPKDSFPVQAVEPHSYLSTLSPPTRCLDDDVLKSFMDELSFDALCPVDDYIFSLFM